MAAASSTAGSAPLRVLCVSSTAERWGAELALATYLKHRPEEVDPRVLCLSGGPLVDLLRADGVPVAASSLEGRPTQRQALAFMRRLHGDLRRSEYDALYATGNKAAILCGPAAISAGVPLVFHRVDLAMRAWTLRTIATASSGIVAVSKAAAAGVPANRLLGIVPPPVRLPEGFRVGEERPVATIGSVGQLHPVKGHHDVIAAAAMLVPEFSDVRVIVAGGRHPAFPDYARELHEIARRAGIADRVELAGHVDRVGDVYERLTLLASGTYRDRTGVGSEALGAAIAEASWAGLPVVATLGGGTAEVVEDGVTGRLVPPRDPAAIAAAIAGYLRDPDAAKAAGERGANLARARFRPAPLVGALFGAIARVARG